MPLAWEQLEATDSGSIALKDAANTAARVGEADPMDGIRGVEVDAAAITSAIERIVGARTPR